MKRKISETDIVQHWTVSAGTQTPSIAVVNTKQFDERARLLTEFVKMWTHGFGASDMMESTNEMKFKNANIEHVVARAAETVDAIWFEAERRGWIIENPPYDEW